MGLLIFVLVITIINIADRWLKRKRVTVSAVFYPPKLDEENEHHNLLPDNRNSESPINKKRKTKASLTLSQRVFTKLHELAASEKSITDEQIKEFSLCATIKDANNGRTCIHWTVQSKAEKTDSEVIEDIKKLVSIGCPIDAKDDTGATALHLAIRKRRIKVATFLLEKIDVNVQDDNGRTALFDAVSIKSLEMVQNILQLDNVDVNALAYTNDTPLIKCCRIDDNNDMVPIVEALLRHQNIQIDKTGDKASNEFNGKMAIHQAAASNSIQILELLINKGAGVSFYDAHVSFFLIRRAGGLL